MAFYTSKGPTSTGGIGSPVTPQSYVVVNGQFDRPFFQKRIGSGSTSPWSGVSEENFALMKHELAFTFNDPLIMPRGLSNGINDPDLRFFTSANGIPVNPSNQTGHLNETELSLLQNPNSSEFLRRKIRGRLNFVGVNLTTMPTPVSGNTHASVAVAGAVTVINSGPEMIDIGSRVVWDLPFFDSDPDATRVVASYGSPTSKCLFQTLPWDCAKKNSVHNTLSYLASGDHSDADVQEMNDLYSEFATAVANNTAGTLTALNHNDASQSVENFLSGFIELQRDLEFRVIGTALTRAEPGAPFDMLLRYNRMS